MSEQLDILMAAFVSSLDDPHPQLEVAARVVNDELIIDVWGRGPDASERRFMMRTHGVESFISTLENGLYRVDFEWRPDLQKELMEELALVASRYLEGHGHVSTRRTWLRKRKTFELEVAGEKYEFA